MNKAEWSDFFFYLKELFKIDKTRKVESIEKINNNLSENKDEDNFKKNNNKSYYGKKKKKYSDY